MKKPLLFTVVILVILLILPAIAFTGWFLKEKKQMNIVILDKTVHSLERNHHRALNWVLANGRFVKDSNRKYLLRKDYYGFFPIKPLRSKQFRRNDFRLSDLPEIVANNDMLYYADTYGVFFNDWYEGINRSRRSRMLYGGLNNNDYLLLAEMRKLNKLVILEHNSFGYPTDAYERYKVEEQFGMQSTGWSGEYYPSLDSLDVPEWLPVLYLKKNRTPWSFTNAGIVLLKGENDVIILEEETHLVSAIPYVTTSSDIALKYGVPEKVAFRGPFDIIDAKENSVLSSFSLETTPEGLELLDRHFLSNVFPAVSGNLGEGNYIYMAGDFATGKMAPWTACFGQPGFLSSLLYSDEVNDPRRFFWLYYKPLLSGLLNDYYLTLE
ncbi:MAG: hypothetical protein LC649_08455 [Bacteroidales bacterium]|nr:hypothetical protein [Bacteroidales bacterium]